MSLPLQERIEGKYEILGKLGEGGMGSIYKVRHRLLEEVRVIKVMRPNLGRDEEHAERFLREARAAIKLRHPNIAQLYDFTVGDEGDAFIVMEFIGGHTFEELLKRSGPPPLALTLAVAQQSLRALDYLHRMSFVHRDISPDNLMLSRDVEGQPLVKLIDLGIAKVLEGDGELTATGLFLGKVRYCSPEQLEGAGGSQVDGRSDLYAFGMVLYELLTGHSAITAKNASGWIAGHLFRPPRPFEETDPDGKVPPELRELVLQALAKKPDERMESAAAFSGRLAEIARDRPLSDEAGTEMLEELLSAHPDEAQAEPPGSTQSRLDREFGLETTPGPRTLGAEGSGRTASPNAPTVQIDALLTGARKLLELGQEEAAQQQIDAVRALDPSNPVLESFLRDNTLTEQMEQPASATEARVRDLEKEVAELLEANDLAAAEARLGEAVAAFGAETEPWKGFRERLDSLRGRARAASLLGAAEDFAAQEDYAQALAALAEAARLDPESSEIPQRFEAFERAREEQETRNRRERLEREIAERLERGELATARGLLESAAEDFPDEEAFEALRAELAEAEVQAQAAALLAQARILGEGRGTGRAFEILDEVREMVAEGSELADLAEEVGRDLAQLREERKRTEEVQQALIPVETAIGEDDLERAEELLEAAVEKLGEDPRFEDTAGRIEHHRERLRNRRVVELLERAHLRVGAEAWESALEELRQAAEIDPDNPEIENLAQRIRAAAGMPAEGTAEDDATEEEAGEERPDEEE